MRRRGRFVAVVGTLVAVAALAGCAGLGGVSVVRSGLEVGGQEVPRVRVYFPGPAPNAGQEQIVRGFLRAGAASDGDYDTARSFLTVDAAKAWVPDGEVNVVAAESELTVTVVDEARATVTGLLVARIGSDGRYHAAAPGETVSAEVSFARIEGEWRIAGLPKEFGRWLTAADLRRLFQPYAVHYVSTSRRTLVRDLRWFPLDHLTSRLARAQLEDVPPDLVGVASTAVPLGTRLTAESVSVVGGVASVELSARPRAEEAQRQNLWAQFVATLTQDPGVAAVALLVDGSVLDPPGARSPLGDPEEVGFLPPPQPGVAESLVRRGDRLVPVDRDNPLQAQDPRVAPSHRADLPTIESVWTGVALSPDGVEVAAVSRDRRSATRWVNKQRFAVSGLGTGLTDPTFDTRGFLWFGMADGADGGGAGLAAISQREPAAAAPPRPVSAPWLADRTIVGIRVSPDGERVAVLSRAGTGPVEVHVTGVVRAPSGQPLSLAQPVHLGVGLPDVTGLAWLGATSLTTLSTPDGQETRPVLLSLDGTSTALPDAPGAVELTTTGGERHLIVRTRDGQVLARSGQVWIGVGSGEQVIVPGR